MFRNRIPEKHEIHDECNRNFDIFRIMLLFFQYLLQQASVFSTVRTSDSEKAPGSIHGIRSGTSCKFLYLYKKAICIMSYLKEIKATQKYLRNYESDLQDIQN